MKKYNVFLWKQACSLCNCFSEKKYRLRDDFFVQDFHTYFSTEIFLLYFSQGHITRLAVIIFTDYFPVVHVCYSSCFQQRSWLLQPSSSRDGLLPKRSEAGHQCELNSKHKNVIYLLFSVFVIHFDVCVIIYNGTVQRSTLIEFIYPHVLYALLYKSWTIQEIADAFCSKKLMKLFFQNPHCCNQHVILFQFN